MQHGELVTLEETSRLLARIEGRLLRFTLEQPLAVVPPELVDYRAVLRENGRELHLVLEGDGGAGAVLRLLAGLGIEVRDVETRRPGLEEVFLRLTGTRPENRHGGAA